MLIILIKLSDWLMLEPEGLNGMNDDDGWMLWEGH